MFPAVYRPSRIRAPLALAAAAMACGAARAPGPPSESPGRAALSGSGTRAALAVPTPPRAAPRPGTDADRAAGVEWRFDVGSAVAARPAVSADGTVVVATSEGTLQAIGPDGALRYSYTLEGNGFGPAVDGAGRVYVATTTGRLYAILPDGQLAWKVKLPVHPSGDVVIAPPWGIAFPVREHAVWVVAARAEPLFHVDAPGFVTSGPAIGGTRIVLGTAEGDVVMSEGAVRRAVAHVGERIRGAPVILPSGEVAVLTGRALHLLDPRGTLLRVRADVEGVALAGEALVVVSRAGDVIRLSADGTETRLGSSGITPGAPPVIAPTGEICVPGEGGELAVVSAGGVSRRVSVSHAPLREPAVDALRRRVIVASGSGTVVAIRVGG